ncbi:hypothetical protein BS78_K143600 [Paspalum vaginatum]|uniref:Uncharacterized protein n=1 Tax=Paspalum vaginatum TaxID=158149 RepID=A0A9W8CGY9_9POAL|nr:hypothetical protein BS78_K143600 [Paspalum vaginatum]
MAVNPPLSSGFNLRSILDKEKLSETNFPNWYRNVRIVLKHLKKEYVLGQPYPEEPKSGASAADRMAYDKHCNDSLDVGCLMLATMSPNLQKQYEDLDAYNMIDELHGIPVSPHVIKMIGHIEALDRLVFELDPKLMTNVILQSLPLSFEAFIMNYHMNSLDKTLTELHGMLKTAEDSIKKTSNHVMVVQRDSKKRKRKGKGKGKAEDRIQNSKPDAKPKDGPSPLDKCFHCGDSGY